MGPEALRQRCVSLLDRIFRSGRDVAYPARQGVRQVTLCGASPGYHTCTDLGARKAADADDVLELLLDIERIQGETNPLLAVRQSLTRII
ncbi:MAG: hypothetical protein AUJ49_06215 [Desulfovibrionaceae bacterium CG1_02_65_16]|nr:MAG: hypothetical protein AUJ49_06215 [Desulfovibrionaceae bacterium CG1_02_65_16]